MVPPEAGEENNMTVDVDGCAILGPKLQAKLAQLVTSTIFRTGDYFFSVQRKML